MCVLYIPTIFPINWMVCTPKTLLVLSFLDGCVPAMWTQPPRARRLLDEGHRLRSWQGGMLGNIMDWPSNNLWPLILGYGYSMFFFKGTSRCNQAKWWINLFFDALAIFNAWANYNNRDRPLPHHLVDHSESRGNPRSRVINQLMVKSWSTIDAIGSPMC